MPESTLSIVEYCKKEGLPFRSELIARYVAAFLSKPFVILAGISGTGKSKLTQLVGEYYTSQSSQKPPLNKDALDGSAFVFDEPIAENNDRFALVAVRPDWIDNQSILGYVNPLTGRYESTQALDIILRAKDNQSTYPDPAQADRYFMLLDEMNLARVEHYFSDWLAASESRRIRSDGKIEQQPVLLHHQSDSMTAHVNCSDGSSFEHQVPSQIELPTNLVVTGTVNIDETTYGVSPKVLDRAMVIEFDEVNLELLKTGLLENENEIYQIPSQLPKFRIPTDNDYRQQPDEVHMHLVKINQILEKARLHIGYRSAKEMALFIEIFRSFMPIGSTNSSTEKALDFAILQKVLPRLAGNRVKLEHSLVELCHYLRDLERPTEQQNILTLEFNPLENARLSNSYRRAVEMLETLRAYGFVSFFK